MTPRPPIPRSKDVVGVGVIGSYVGGADGAWSYEEERPGPGWHRHDWKARQLVVLSDQGVHVRTIRRRRWRLHGTTTTRLDRSPDEVRRRHVALLVLLLKLWAWLSSGRGVHPYDELHPAIEAHGSRRTVQRWLRALLPDATRLQQALRAAVIERFDFRAVERMDRDLADGNAIVGEGRGAAVRPVLARFGWIRRGACKERVTGDGLRGACGHRRPPAAR